MKSQSSTAPSRASEHTHSFVSDSTAYGPPGPPSIHLSICIVKAPLLAHTMYVPPSTLPPFPTRSTQPVKTHARRHAHPHVLPRQAISGCRGSRASTSRGARDTFSCTSKRLLPPSTRGQRHGRSFMSLAPCRPLTTTTTITTTTTATTTITTLPKNHHLEATTRWRASITRRPHDAPSQLALPTPQPQILSGQRKPE
ncbi:hypothetical protein LY76DRAFT_595010 [Colletotrichum caudatum]|nr:hypothetical protein LY76DRAFT_595010 [Colletotrichum caudatum]